MSTDVKLNTPVVNPPSGMPGICPVASSVRHVSGTLAMSYSEQYRTSPVDMFQIRNCV